MIKAEHGKEKAGEDKVVKEVVKKERKKQGKK